MDPRIDLTENNDFSPERQVGTTFHIREFIGNIPDIETPLMSKDEYDAIVRHERIFGKVIHLNSKSIVFDHDKKEADKWRSVCLRCGKVIRYPWAKKWDLCEECYSHFMENEIPWKEKCSTLDNTKFNLFNLR